MTKTTQETQLSFAQKWVRPIIGLVIALAFFIPVLVWTMNEKSAEHIKIAVMCFTGALVGYTLSRSKFGFAGPIKKMVMRGDGRQAKALIILFIITSVIAGAAMIAFGDAAFGKVTSKPLGIGTIVGGLLFGIGMTLSTGCASGTLTDIGEGLVPAVWVLLFFMMGSAVGVIPVDIAGKGKDPIFQFTNDASMYKILGAGAGMAINVVLLGIILGAVVIFHKWRAYKDAQILIIDEEPAYIAMDAEISPEFNLRKIFSYETWKKIFNTRWTWIMGVLVIAIWFGINIMFKSVPGITTAYAHWGVSMFHGFGNSHSLAFNNGWDVTKDAESWQNFGIIIGALVGGLLANKFNFADWKIKWQHWVYYAIGGFMMGLGARLAYGCNFGALFTNVSFGSGAGYIFGIFLFGGAVGGVYLARLLKHNIPGNTFKKGKGKK